MLFTTISMVITGYLIGSISSAILLSRLCNFPDPRTSGSKNPGATNILRISNKYIAATVLIFDMLKGTISVWGAYFLGVSPTGLGIVAIAICLGHMYPIFFSFKGGKGVATALGVMLPLGLKLTGCLIITWLLVIKVTRYSSLAAIVTVSVAPLFTWFYKPEYIYSVLMLSVLIIFRHKSNIVRLLEGTEPKVVKR